MCIDGMGKMSEIPYKIILWSWLYTIYEWDCIKIKWVGLTPNEWNLVGLNPWGRVWGKNLAWKCL